MKHTTMFWITLVVLGVLGGCRAGHGAGGSSAAAPEGGTPAVGETAPAGGTFYTQFALHHERDRFPTTNYRRGLLLPINSEVTLQSMDSRKIVVDVKSTGRRLVVENMPKHTGETTEQAFDKIFGAKPVDLSRFTEAERQAILAGRSQVGMSRDAVLAALGPPPAIETPTLDLKRWKYWNTRWTTFVVAFDDTWHVTGTGR